jgi:thymidylate synthase (FAD)
MSMIEPRVIKLGETKLDMAGVQELAQHFSAQQWLDDLHRGPKNDAESLLEVAGRTCYRSFAVGLNPNITKIRTDSQAYLRNIIKSKHGSVLEHASVTFAFLNVSRVLTHELVRHRAGVAISQESLRFVRPRDIKLWLPPDIDSIAKQFLAIVEKISSDYRSLEACFAWDKLSFDEKKRITSALRRILPNGIATNVIWTANHRTLRWVIEMRTDPSAEVEIRKVFNLVAEICTRDYPSIYADFSKQRLPDGTFQYIPEFSKV